MTPPQATGLDTSAADSTEKRVTWVELFFDLVFVYAVTRAAELLHADHSPLGVLGALVAFVPVYWVWVGTTMHADLHDVDTTKDRIGVFAVAWCGLLLAIALPEAYTHQGVLFGVAYWAARLVLLALVTGRDNRGAFISFTVAALVTGPLVLAGGLLDGHARLALWALAGVIDLSVPLLARRRLASVPFNPGHLTERFGTFIIIALGETVIATAAAAGVIDGLHLAALAACFVVICGLWWVYFAFSPDAIRAQLESSAARIDIIRPVLSYGHLALIAGIIGVATAIGRVVAEPTEPLHLDTAALLFGGPALFLVTFAFTRWRLFHTLAIPRLVAAAACLALIAAAPYVPAGATAATLAVVLVVLNVVEHFVLPRTLQPLAS